MPSPFVDCHACACLIDPAEVACPFCGAAQRRTDLSSLLALGLVLGLTAASCTDKPGPTTQASSTTAQTTGTTGSTGSTGSGGDTDDDPTLAQTTAYAGPPESTSTSPTSTGSTGSTSGETFDDTATASSVAYAAPPDPHQQLEPAPGK